MMYESYIVFWTTINHRDISGIIYVRMLPQDYTRYDIHDIFNIALYQV